MHFSRIINFRHYDDRSVAQFGCKSDHPLAINYTLHQILEMVVPYSCIRWSSVPWKKPSTLLIYEDWFDYYQRTHHQQCNESEWQNASEYVHCFGRLFSYWTLSGCCAFYCRWSENRRLSRTITYVYIIAKVNQNRTEHVWHKYRIVLVCNKCR